MIAFGSCNRQDKPQNYWDKIISLHPDWFFWIGDAVYAKNQSLQGLEDGLYQQLMNPYYQKLINSTKIDGVWDDHDYGINDAGKYVIDKALRQKKYIDFLANSGTRDISYLYDQDGLFHSRELVYNDLKVKIIFLDTRSFRDHHFVRSLGELDFPLSAIIGAAFRASYSVMGFGRTFGGDVLGSTQWKWLENEISENNSDLIIMVSSIQIFTSNPVVESWGHFPLAKKRFLDLVSKHSLQNVLFLSGDVHMGEISSVNYVKNNEQTGKWYEITSSGLTHTCTKSFFNKPLCMLMTSLFASHRSTTDSFVHDKNFGTISFSGSKENFLANITLYSLEGESSEAALSLQIPFTTNSGIIDRFEYSDFPVINAPIRTGIYLIVFSMIWITIYCFRRWKVSKRKQS